jgi:hypothetical protein
VLTIVVGQNAVATSRTAAVSVNGTRAVVTQDAAPCRYELNSSAVDLPAGGGAVTVAVAAVEGCDWSASSNVPGCRGSERQAAAVGARNSRRSPILERPARGY